MFYNVHNVSTEVHVYNLSVNVYWEYASQYMYLLLQSQKFGTPWPKSLAKRLKSKQRLVPECQQLIQQHRNHFTELKQASFGQLQGLCLSPLFLHHCLMRGQEGKKWAQTSLTGATDWVLFGRHMLSPYSHCVRLPLLLIQWLIHEFSRLLPSSSCRKSWAWLFSTCASETCCVPSTWCSSSHPVGKAHAGYL